MLLFVLLMSTIPAAIFADENSNGGSGYGDQKLLDARVEVREETKVETGDTRTESRLEIKTETKDGESEERMEFRQRTRQVNEEGTEDNSDISNTRSRISIMERIEKLPEEKRAKLEFLGKIKQERLQILDETSLGKVANLEKDEIIKLANLRAERLKEVAMLEGEELSKLAKLTRARQEELANLGREEIKKRLEETRLVKVKTSSELNRRDVEERLILRAREDYSKAEDDFMEARQNFLEAKERIALAKEEGKDTFEPAKEHLENIVSAMVAHLEKLKAKIQESENLGNEEVITITEEIDIKISEIKAIGEKLDEATTTQNLKVLRNELVEIWKDTKQVAKLHAYRVADARIEGLTNRAKVLEKKLEILLVKIGEDGISIDVEDKLVKFSNSVDEAAKKTKEVKEKIREAVELKNKGVAENAEQLQQLHQEINNALREARVALEEANNTLKEIVVIFREAKEDVDFEVKEEVEVEFEGEVEG